MFLSLDNLADIFPNPPAGLDPVSLDFERIPKHIAIIMDGNGRWASSRGLSRGEGHRAGVEGVREAITTCNDLGVRYLTIYSFSTENWSRPEDEINGLMELFSETLLDELAGLEEHAVRIRVLGDEEKLPETTRDVFQMAERDTADNGGMTLALAVNYGGRQELVSAMRKLGRRIEAGELRSDQIDADMISGTLWTHGMPDPDLLIRTSGEARISNFLLWQIAYSEFYITDMLWPDFNRYELLRAILSYQGRDRRFGGVGEGEA